MAKKKIVYLELNQMLEVRLVGREFEASRDGWLEQMNPSHEILLFKNWSEVAFTNPKLRVGEWPLDGYWD